MKKWKRVNSIILALAMAVSLMACGFGVSASESSNDADGNGRYDYVVFSTNNDPNDLSPWNLTANSKGPITLAIYDTLFNYIDGEYVPCVAKSYTEVDDLHWDVEIYDYVTDWNGNNITADDIVFDYQVYVDSGFATRFDAYESVEATDTYTLRFTWNTPITEVGALERIFCFVPVYSQAEYENGEFATQPVATGPYILDSYVADSKVILQCNEDYWQQDESLSSSLRQRNVDTVEFDIISEPSQNVIALEAGTIDFSQYVNSEDLYHFEDGGDYSDQYGVENVSVTEGYFITCNNSDSSPLADENLRKAVFYAIDADAIVTAVGGGLGACKALGCPYYPDYVADWENEETYFNTCDLDLAKEYLDASDYNGETLTLLGCNDSIYSTIMTVIQASLGQIGINVEIEALETAQVQSLSADQDAWDLYIVKFGGGLDINAINKMVNANEYDGEYALGFIVDDQLQSLYETAVTQATWDDEHMTELFEYVTDNAYAYTFAYTYVDVVYNKDITDIYMWDAYFFPTCFSYNLD